MKETDPYDHKIVIIQCHNVNEPQVSRLAICNPPLALADTTICVRCPESGFFSHFPCWKRCLSAGKKNLQVFLQIKIKRFLIKGTSFLPVLLTGAFRSSSHLRPSCQVNSWCSCARDTQPAWTDSESWEQMLAP